MNNNYYIFILIGFMEFDIISYNLYTQNYKYHNPF